jgi:SpoVK/Ycf46/Vps4 family AAA+-type ATPase
LTSQVDKKVIYLPSATAEHLTDPGFLDFVIDCKNSIFLLEDAEKIIKSRDNNENAAISNILNITDGLLGDCLNVLVIATFNTSRDNIDKALLRKGRLLFEHYFDELSIDKCNKIFESLGLDKKTDIPMTLADIFNSEENYCKKEEDKKKIGF